MLRGRTWSYASCGLERGRSCEFRRGRPSRLSTVQCELARHSDLVYEQQRSCYRGVNGPIASCGLERGRSCGEFQRGRPSRLSTVQCELARHSDLVYEQQRSCYRGVHGPTLPAGWSVAGLRISTGTAIQGIFIVECGTRAPQ